MPLWAFGVGFLYATMLYLSPVSHGSVQCVSRPLYSYHVYFSLQCDDLPVIDKEVSATRKISQKADQARAFVSIPVGRAYKIVYSM